MGILTPSARIPVETLRRLRGGGDNLLFEKYPGLLDRIPWRQLGEFPTPIEELPRPADDVRLFVKRDDRSSTSYGGNKVRKLEHLLAAAEGLDRQTLITMGGLGSNHALATTMHGRSLGFEVELALYDQPDTPLVRKTHQALHDAGATVHLGGGMPGAFALARRRFTALRKEGRAPYFIMVGGTSRLGCVGHVAAGLELSQQVAAGEIPEPDYLFVPLGTCGTAAGLVAGLKLGGLRTRVAAVRVAEPFAANAFTVRYLAQDVLDYLHEMDPAVPALKIRRDDFDVLPAFIGPGYGHATPQAEAAVGWAAPRLSLETTYTGKALAAALDFCRAAGKPHNVLFWNTYNSVAIRSAGSLS